MGLAVFNTVAGRPASSREGSTPSHSRHYFDSRSDITPESKQIKSRSAPRRHAHGEACGVTDRTLRTDRVGRRTRERRRTGLLPKPQGSRRLDQSLDRVPPHWPHRARARARAPPPISCHTRHPNQRISGKSTTATASGSPGCRICHASTVSPPTT